MNFAFDIISIIIRVIQFIWTIINLGLAAGFLSKYDHSYSRVVYSLVISVFTIIYLAVVTLPICLRYISPLIALVAESIFMIFWLASFAAMADVFGDLDCGFYYFGTNSLCEMGKAMIGFGVLNWLAFCVSLVLLLVYTAVPCMRFGGFKSMLAANNFSTGAIFSEVIPSRSTQDAENTVGTTAPEINPETSGEPKVLDKVESPATPTE